MVLLLAGVQFAFGQGGLALAPGEMRETQDLLPLLEQAQLEHPGVAEHRNPAFSAGRALDAIFLHPPSEDAEATLRFPPLQVATGGLPLLLFSIGMQDGFAWNDTKSPPDGVRFGVRINDEPVFSESLHDHGWRLRAIDLTRWQGATIAIAFTTYKIAGTSYDWALFGAPRVVSVHAVDGIEGLGARKASPGIALARIDASVASRARIGGDPASGDIPLPVGSTLVPVEYTEPAALTLEVLEGTATLVNTHYVAHSPLLQWVDLYCEPALPFAGEPFTLVARLHNAGRGSLVAMPEMLGRLQAGLLPEVAGKNVVFPIVPGDDLVLRWDALTVSDAGNHEVQIEMPATRLAVGRCRFSVQGMRPAQAGTLPWHDGGEAGAAWLRYPIPKSDFALSFFVSQGACSATIEKEGKAVALLASLGGIHQIDKDALQNPPLLPNGVPMAIGAPDNSANSDSGQFQISSIENGADGGVILRGGAPWATRLEITPDADKGRLRFHYVFDLERAMNRLAVSGPMLIVGDGQPDVRRAAGVFSGLEFIEGGEGSSSTRDLVPPLNARFWPAAYTITAPAMGVASDDLLIGWLWSAPPTSFYPGNPRPAYFDAPANAPGIARMRAFVPVPDEQQHIGADFWLVLEERSTYEKSAKGQDTSRAALLLDLYRHYFDVYGLPAPSPPPRTWDDEKALCADAYLNAAGSADPVGFRHCAGWNEGAFAAHAVPARLLLRDGLPDDAAPALSGRVDAVVARAVAEGGAKVLASNSGTHIVNGETPFFEGYLGESLRTIRDQGFQWLDKREDGVWKWHPGDARSAALGKDGDDTLGQAALGARIVLRAARLSGNLSLRAQALDALKILEQYAVPRGAQTWECPLYQPDILAAAHAISAYMDAYQLTGDQHYIEQATYWAKTGLPFIYFWSPTGHPAMLYNTIPVFGSTWFTHSWIGLPVVWCGLVYAYALQDLAPFDNSFDWKTIAQGITNSAMHQQYTDGPSKGCYPDSWNVIAGTPNPADINPENIVLNACRLRGNSAEVRTRRVPGRVGEALINSAFDLPAVLGEVGRGKLGLVLRGKPGFPGYTAIVPAQSPKSVAGAGSLVADSAALAKAAEGWLYDREAQALILKHTPGSDEWKTEIDW